MIVVIGLLDGRECSVATGNRNDVTIAKAATVFTVQGRESEPSAQTSATGCESHPFAWRIVESRRVETLDRGGRWSASVLAAPPRGELARTRSAAS